MKRKEMRWGVGSQMSMGCVASEKIEKLDGRKIRVGYDEHGNCLVFEWLIPEYRYVNKTTRYRILSEQGWRCAWCGCKLKYGKKYDREGEPAEIDHIHPFSERDEYGAGINDEANLQALCPACNRKKSDL